MCRTHNSYLAEVDYGRERTEHWRVKVGARRATAAADSAALLAAGPSDCRKPQLGMGGGVGDANARAGPAFGH